jgi:two-component system, NarL family, response regulator NreC
MDTTNAGGLQEFNSPLIFTKREYKILEYSRQLMTNQEIADKLNVAQSTVKSHRKNIMRKLDIHGKTAMNKFIMSLKFT